MRGVGDVNNQKNMFPDDSVEGRVEVEEYESNELVSPN